MRVVVTAVNEAGRSYVLSDEDVAVKDQGRYIFETDPGQTTAWAAAIEPEKLSEGPEPAPGASRLILTDGVPNPHWHTTRTVDYFYLIDGEVTLELDEESVDLRGGDMVIQQATHHLWQTNGKPWRALVALDRLPV